MHEYTYRLAYSAEDEQYIGLCDAFPSLSWLAETEAEALRGIKALVKDVVADMLAKGETLPVPLAVQS